MTILEIQIMNGGRKQANNGGHQQIGSIFQIKPYLLKLQQDHTDIGK